MVPQIDLIFRQLLLFTKFVSKDKIALLNLINKPGSTENEFIAGLELGTGCANRRFLNLGTAKKGGSDLMSGFFGGLVKMYKGQP